MKVNTCVLGWTAQNCRMQQFYFPVQQRDINPFQKHGCHPDVQTMPAAVETLFLDMFSDSSIINLVEQCHYIIEYGLTITTSGRICCQFFFVSPLYVSTPDTEEGGEENKHTVGIVKSDECERFHWEI